MLVVALSVAPSHTHITLSLDFVALSINKSIYPCMVECVLRECSRRIQQLLLRHHSRGKMDFHRIVKNCGLSNAFRSFRRRSDLIFSFSNSNKVVVLLFMLRVNLTNSLRYCHICGWKCGENINDWTRKHSV